MTPPDPIEQLSKAVDEFCEKQDKKDRADRIWTIVILALLGTFLTLIGVFLWLKLS